MYIIYYIHKGQMQMLRTTKNMLKQMINYVKVNHGDIQYIRDEKGTTVYKKLT